MSDTPAELQLYLASTSPRRRQLLQQLGLAFEPLAIACEERPRPGERPRDYVLRVARDKAEAGLRLPRARPELPLLAADTEVVLDDQVLGKPRDGQHAVDMLLALAGREHQVMSAVVVANAGRAHWAVQVSSVRLRRISRREAEAYWRSGEPAGKAGGYAVQGLGAVFIERLQGSYSGVMGLPLFETAELLARFDIQVIDAINHEEDA